MYTHCCSAVGLLYRRAVLRRRQRMCVKGMSVWKWTIAHAKKEGVKVDKALRFRARKLSRCALREWNQVLNVWSLPADEEARLTVAARKQYRRYSAGHWLHEWWLWVRKVARPEKVLTEKAVAFHHGWVVVHRAEEICQVPYRYYKKMPGELFIDGQPHGTCEEVLYAKPLLANIGHTYAQLTERLSSAGELLNNDDPLFPLRAVQCRRVVDRSIELLDANTLAFVAHRDEARKWLSDLKGQELGELKPEERFDMSEVP